MAYSFIDEDGFLGDGPSITGLKNFKALVAAQDSKALPATLQLLEHGATHQTKQLAMEARALAAKAKDPTVASTCRSLAKDASKAKGMVMLVQ